MKLSFPVIILIFGTAILALAACSKEFHDVVYQGQRAPAALTESARHWYHRHRGERSTEVERRMLARYWEKAELMQTADSATVLVVPWPGPPVDNPSLAFRRFLVFEPSGMAVSTGKIVELVGDKYPVNNQANLLLTGRAAGVQPGFNGSILQYDVNYRPLGNAHYTGGREDPGVQSAIIRTPGSSPGRSIRLHGGRLPLSALRPGRYLVNYHLYAVKGMDPYKTLVIEENDSLISAFFRHPQNHGAGGLKLAGTENIVHSFSRVLGKDRIRQLAASGTGRFLVTLYFTGEAERVKPAAIRFTIFQPGKNDITFREIDRVSEYLKKNITMEVPPAVNKENQVWPMAQAVDFSRLEQ